MSDDTPDTQYKQDTTIDPDKITRYQKFHLFLTGAGVFFTVVSLCFVAFQVWKLSEQSERNTVALNLQSKALEAQTESVKAQKRAVEGQVWGMVTQNDIELSKVLIANPKVLPYFRSSLPISSRDKNYELVMEISDMYLSFFDMLFDDYLRTLPGMDPKGKYWVLWENYMRDSFSTSPALCARYNESRSWYTSKIDQYTEGCKNHKKPSKGE